jgi:carbonic anhydrase
MTFTIDDHVVKAAYSGNCTKSTMQIPGVDGTYEALQFHIHTSSEHTIDGAFFGAELHVVHKQTDADRYAVYGMMIEATNDKNHEVFEAFLDGWTSIADDTVEACTTSVDSGGTTNANTSFTLTNDNSTAITQQARIGSQRKLSEDVFNVYDMVPKGSSFYHYDGGLTTPPCSEVVWWNLADTPVSISVLQYTRLTQLVLEYRNTETCELATVASPSGSTSRPTQALNGRIVKRICPTAFVEEVKTGSDTSTASVVSIVSALATAGAAAFALQVF